MITHDDIYNKFPNDPYISYNEKTDFFVASNTLVLMGHGTVESPPYEFIRQFESIRYLPDRNVIVFDNRNDVNLFISKINSPDDEGMYNIYSDFSNIVWYTHDSVTIDSVRSRLLSLTNVFAQVVFRPIKGFVVEVDHDFHKIIYKIQKSHNFEIVRVPWNSTQLIFRTIDELIHVIKIIKLIGDDKPNLHPTLSVPISYLSEYP